MDLHTTNGKLQNQEKINQKINNTNKTPLKKLNLSENQDWKTNFF